jgi:PqqD family protein of HPr-rel-A system
LFLIPQIMTPFPAVRSGLLCNSLDDQVLVYDPASHIVHLLDPTTARIMELLRSGAPTEDELKAAMPGDIDPTSRAALLDMAIGELRTAELLDEQSSSTLPRTAMSRRELLRKVALTGIAAALIPTIVTLSATRGYGQGSLCRAKKQCCTVDSDCCSNKCDSSTGTGCTTGPLECH